MEDETYSVWFSRSLGAGGELKVKNVDMATALETIKNLYENEKFVLSVRIDID